MVNKFSFLFLTDAVCTKIPDRTINIEIFVLKCEAKSLDLVISSTVCLGEPGLKK